jgi:hypothetical protein
MYAVMPLFSMHLSCPTSSRISPNKLFAKQIANNGHWSYGGNIGLMVDFLRTLSIMVNIGGTCFNQGAYCNIPVPTSTYQEGIFPYTADANIRPGYNFTFGLGFSATRPSDHFSFSAEYRVIRHDEDKYDFTKMNNPFVTEYVPNLFQRYDTNVFKGNIDDATRELVQKGTASTLVVTSVDVYSEIATDTAITFIPAIPTIDASIPYPSSPTPLDAVAPAEGVLYWGNIMEVVLPNIIITVPANLYSPRRFSGDEVFDVEIPFPTILDIEKQCLEQRSSWTVHLLNFTASYDISEYTSLGLFLQQPFSLRNAYNSMTFGCSVNMIF